MIFNIIKNKKGMFFTMLIILLLSLFVLSYGFYSITKDREPVNKRIQTLNNFVFSVQEDLERELYISGFRVIFLFEKRIVEENEYISDIPGNFSEMMFNGTMNNGSYEGGLDLMEGVTFNDIMTQMSETGAKINANVSNSSVPEFTISQDDPWKVKVNLQVDIAIKDNAGLASWNRDIDLDVYIPVTNFEDPIYYMETEGRVTNKILKTIHPDFTDDNEFEKHWKNSYYIAHNDAPSFLQRLQGDLSANPGGYGIESLINPENLSDLGVTVTTKTLVDYRYFNSTDVGMPTSFDCRFSDLHIDNDHLPAPYDPTFSC
ncbi:hypothetical protein GOV14_05695 [Candidatus Pacearchaeota archaeon]|nr:hypothetical protein [Candidatus Pacearchaeota archaeon]